MKMIRFAVVTTLIVSHSWADCPDLSGLWWGSCPINTITQQWRGNKEPKHALGPDFSTFVKVNQTEGDCNHMEFAFEFAESSKEIKTKKFEIGNPIVEFELNTKYGERKARAWSERLNWKKDVLVLTTNYLHNYQFDSKKAFSGKSQDHQDQRTLVKLSLKNGKLHFEKTTVQNSTDANSIPYSQTMISECDLEREISQK